MSVEEPVEWRAVLRSQSLTKLFGIVHTKIQAPLKRTENGNLDLTFHPAIWARTPKLHDFTIDVSQDIYLV